MSETEIVITRVFDAPRSRVYRVWTEPKLVALWWGCEGATNTIHEMDVRPGGAWRIDMRVASGTVYPNRGTFRTVVADELLEYSHVLPRAGDPTRLIEVWNRVTFADAGAGTQVDLAVRAPSADDLARLLASGMREGIGQGLDKLGHLLRRDAA